MSRITKSGIYYDEAGQLILVTQGLGGYTLVTRKKILFRLYMSLSAASCLTVLARITYRMLGFTITRSMVIPSASLVIDETGPLGSSVGIVLSGDMFPSPTALGKYSVSFDVYGASPSVQHFALDELAFLPSGRLRLLIHNVVGMSPWNTTIEPNITWLFELFKGLERLSAMSPVRDGIRLGLTHTDAGICFTYGEDLDAWPAVCPSGGAPPCTPGEIFDRNMRETREINATGTAERADATVLWRPRDPGFPGGEGVGGKAISYNSPPGTGLAGVVAGVLNGKEFTGAILAQEIGHLFGLEPPDSPHFDDPLDRLHSKDPAHNDPFAFDFYKLVPYRPQGRAFLGDVMNNFGGGVGQGSDMVLYNAFDWEHLRQQYVKLPGMAARSRRSPRERQVELVATLDAACGGPPIKLENLDAALPEHRGVAWNWTACGFQPTPRGGRRKAASALSPGAEGLRSWLADSGVTEFHAPVGNRPLPMVIDPNAPTVLQRENVGGMYWL